MIPRHDYLAFGEDAGPGAPFGPAPQQFTGTERDPETFLDYMGARYYRNLMGRFNAVDPVVSTAALTNPQQWNRYAYALNGPLRFTDPTGRDPDEPGDDKPSGFPEVADLYFADLGWLAFRQDSDNFNAQSAAPAADDAIYQGQLSVRDKAYLDKYYDAVTALAKDYKVDAALVLGVGIESAFASGGTYLRTGDAFGMTGGTTKHMTSAKSPADNVKQFFDSWGGQIRNSQANAVKFINALLGRDASGKRVSGWKVYNTVNSDWQNMIGRGIRQMQRDIPIFLARR